MRLLSRLFGWFLAIAKDRYIHPVLGTTIASVILCIFSWLPLWINILISFVVVLAAALLKDLVIDSTADWVDILCTWFGGALLWLPVILLYYV